MENGIKYILSKDYILQEPRHVGKWLIYQIGRRYCAPGSVVSAHRHGNYLELTVITGGKGCVLVNGVARDVAAGDTQLAFPSDLHEIRSDIKEPLCYDFLSIWESEDTTEIAETVAFARALGKNVLQNARIGQLLAYAIDEVNAAGQGVDTVLESLMELIFTYTRRSLLENSSGDLRTVSEAEQLSYRVMSYIDKNLTSIHRLPEVAEALNYNYGYLSALFKRTTGRSMIAYYAERRFAAADTLLRAGMSVCEVAMQLGYDSPYSFSRAYRTHFGYPPSATRLAAKRGRK